MTDKNITHISHTARAWLHCRNCLIHLAPIRVDLEGKTFIEVANYAVYRARVVCQNCGYERGFYSVPFIEPRPSRIYYQGEGLA